MSKFKKGDKVITPLGVGVVSVEEEFIFDLDEWHIKVVVGEGFGFNRVLTFEVNDLKPYKTPHERLLELGWIIDEDDMNPANIEFYYKDNKVLIIDKALKVIKTLYGIDLQLVEILLDYLKELENENN